MFYPHLPQNGRGGVGYKFSRWTVGVAQIAKGAPWVVFVPTLGGVGGKIRAGSTAHEGVPGAVPGRLWFAWAGVRSCLLKARVLPVWKTLGAYLPFVVCLTWMNLFSCLQYLWNWPYLFLPPSPNSNLRLRLGRECEGRGGLVNA